MRDGTKTYDESAEAAYAAMGIDINDPYLGCGEEFEDDPAPEAGPTTNIPIDVTELRLALRAAGYCPVPVLRHDYADKSAGKRPTLNNWQKICATADEREIRRWACDNHQRECTNTGLLCGEMIGLDLDVLNKKLARQVMFLADSMLPPTPLIRIGKAPKTLRVFRADGVHHKILTPRFAIPDGTTALIEALGAGNQFVAFGTHPETKQAYFWPGLSPLDVPFRDLPVLGNKLLRDFMREADATIRAAGGVDPKEKAKPATTHVAKPRPNRIGGFPPPTRDEIASALQAVPNAHDWHGWYKIGAALYDGLGDEGEDLFIAWSAQSTKNDPDYTGQKWRSFRISPPTITIASLFFEARQNGWLPEREEQKPASRNSEPPGECPTDAGNWTEQVPPVGEGAGGGAAGDWTQAVPPIGEPGPVRKAKPAKEPEWCEPVDFLAHDNTTLPVLEECHVPAPLWPFVKDVADRMGSDPAAVALAALVCCASVVSDAWSVQVRRYDTAWTEQARLWGAIVGAPSVKKSPVIKVCSRPIDRLEIKAHAEHKERMAIWEALEAQAKAAKTAPPPRPKLDRYLAEGSTVEALSEVLRDDEEARFRVPCKKILSRQDEMSELIAGFDRYRSGGKGGSDRGAYLRLYNGGRYVVDRIARGSFAVSDWSACLLGGIQPEPIQRIARESADDGLLQRFSFCVATIQSAGIDRAPDQAADERYSALFPALVALRPVVAIGSDYARPVVFHADAHQHREEIDAVARVMAAMPDVSARLKAALDKWPALFARLCPTFHMIQVADAKARNQTAPFVQVIPEAVAGMVAGYMRDVLLPHLLRAEALMFSTDQTSHARWIAGFILVHGLERIATRDIMRNYKVLSAPEAKREMMAAMENLTALGWVDPDGPANPVKGVTSWTVNPAVHQIFAKHAQKEAERRQEAREKIAEDVARVRAQKRTKPGE